MADRLISIGLLGYGTVGSNVYQLLENQQQQIARAINGGFAVKKILVRDLSVPRSGAAAELFTDNFEDILEDEEITLVIELMGGVEPAFDYITAVLERGKAVVTANKQLLSQQGAYLFQLAEKNNTSILFEASVAGAIPIIKVLRESMVAADLDSISGIVNGTTNYILSEMERTGAKYENALARAQEWGYAEADPVDDINGKDAAAKMAILASIGFHTPVTLKDVANEGIEYITSLDIAYAKELGFSIKLLGIARLYDEKINVRVYPALVPHGHPLASVTGAYNAVFLKGSSIDEIMLSGPGAGGVETASAVISDMASTVRQAGMRGSATQLAYSDLAFYEDADVVSTFFLRLEVQDDPGVLASIAQVFGENNVSIESVIQKGRGVHAELVMIFHPVKEESFMAAIEAVKQLSVVKSEPRPIRVEGIQHEQ